MSKKIITHLIQSLDSGGCENMLLRTLPLVNKFEHIIITLHDKGELAKTFQEKGITVISINQNNLVDINSYKRLLNIIKSLKPSLIITYLIHADLVGRIVLQALQNIKVIPFLRTTYNHKKYWQARLFEKLSKGMVNQYLANSESVKDFYIKQIGVTRNKVTVIPNGIDTDYFDKIPKDQTLRKKLGIHDDDIVLISVANLHVNKGHKFLLEAFESLYKNHGNIKLLLIGDGTEKENLLKQIKNYNSKNSILFLGTRNDVPKLLKISDIFVLPTIFEGMSNAIMEAMACELPIITTNIPENLSILNNNSALLIPSKNTHALLQSINKLITNSKLRRSLGKNAKRKIISSFNLNKIARNLSDNIDELLI